MRKIILSLLAFLIGLLIILSIARSAFQFLLRAEKPEPLEGGNIAKWNKE